MVLNERFNKPSQPAWVQRSHRALQHIDAPRVADVAPNLNRSRRPLALGLIFRPVAAAALFFITAASGYWLVAVPITWLVYGGTLTAVHHLIHSSMGLSPRSRRFWLSVLGMLVVESGHALQATHLAHHRSGSDHPDPEGYIENVSWSQLPLAAMKFRYRLALWGYRNSPRRRRIAAEMTGHALLHLLSLGLLGVTPLIWIYLTLIHIASVAFAALAGKGPQTNYGREIETPNVRVISRFGRFLLFSHDRHLEHHLYPKVPLPWLRHLDQALEPVWDTVPTLQVRMPV